MDSILILERTYDESYIKTIVSEMWDCVCEDGHTLEEWLPEPKANCWIRMGDCGLYCLHATNKTTLEIHAFILPEFRKEHSLQSGKEILRYICDNTTYTKVIAQVPFLYPNVKDFCLKNGFVVEGINRLSHQKDGVIVDQWLLGITRDEIEEGLKTWDL